MKSKILFLYHFYAPDSVVSARLYQQLCEDLATQGWGVEVWPSNRSCHDSSGFQGRETLADVSIHRVWRPSFSQASFFGRSFNSIWMLFAWAIRFLFCGFSRPDCVVVGTDPVLAVMIAPWIKLVSPKTKVIHWSFDVYPDAAIANGQISEKSIGVKNLRWFLRGAFRKCDCIVDIGACMRNRLSAYGSSARLETITPWAMEEPVNWNVADKEERSKLFGDADIAILYSGSFGLAHRVDLSLILAQELIPHGVRFCFGVQGRAKEQLRKKIEDLSAPISFADFVEEGELRGRLEAADIHLIALKEEWSGTVVPSKFFASLAVGRPVLFEGSENSAIAGWIKKYRLGWVLNKNSFDSVKREIKELLIDKNKLKEMQLNCRKVYDTLFSKKVCLSKWHKLLQEFESEDQ